MDTVITDSVAAYMLNDMATNSVSWAKASQPNKLLYLNVDFHVVNAGPCKF
jgi:hypothetical protein